MPKRIEAVDFLGPLTREPFHVLAVRRPDRMDPGRKRLDRGARITDQREPRMLLRVELRDVHVDEAHLLVLERRLRRGREVRPARADADHEVAEKYGVWQEKSRYGRKYMGIARTTYLIGPDGKVVQRWDNVKVNGHVEAVAEALG